MWAHVDPTRLRNHARRNRPERFNAASLVGAPAIRRVGPPQGGGEGGSILHHECVVLLFYGDAPEWSLKLVSTVKTQWAVSFGSGDTNLLLKDSLLDRRIAHFSKSVLLMFK